LVVVDQRVQPAVQTGMFVNNGLLRDILVGGHCIGNGIVQTAVKNAKVIGKEGDSLRQCQFGHGLADVAIFVHHLIYR